MNSLRRLATVGALTIGTLALATSTAFAASSYILHVLNRAPISHISSTPDGESGKTEYEIGNNTFIVTVTNVDSRRVAARFYVEGKRDGPPLGFKWCGGSYNNRCPDVLYSLPPMGSLLCMETGVENKKNATELNDYTYGPRECFQLDY